MRCVGNIVLLVTTCLVLPGYAQNPSDLTFILAPANGRTTFRMGEAINVEFRMSSTAPGKYVVSMEYQAKFISDPVDGLVSPQSPSHPAGQLFNPGPRGGARGGLVPLTANPTVLERQLNLFYSFRKPGHYRFTAETDQVGPAAGDFFNEKHITVRSNSIEIDIVRPEPGWVESQLQTNLAMLAQWTPSPPPGLRATNPDPMIERDAIKGVRALGLLETREAALALVDFYGKGVPISISQYIDQGLRRSPYPTDIIAAMEKQIDMPDIPITTQWFGIFFDLEVMGISNSADRANVYAKCREKVVAGIEKKRGDASEISLRTLAQFK